MLVCVCVCVLVAIYPQAATNFQACFGERLVINSSEHWIINLKWDLPEGKVDCFIDIRMYRELSKNLLLKRFTDHQLSKH